MQTTLRHLRSCLLFGSGLAFLGAPLLANAAPLSDEDEKFMTIYEQIQKSLVEDNANAAKDAAHALPNNLGQGILNAPDLKDVREAFYTLSKTAEQKVAGQPDWHVFYCPMAKRDWVQHSTSVANPYEGKEMLTCGVEKKS